MKNCHINLIVTLAGYCVMLYDKSDDKNVMFLSCKERMKMCVW